MARGGSESEHGTIAVTGRMLQDWWAMDRGEYPPGGPICQPLGPPPRRRTSGGNILAAAMLAVGEIIEPDKTHVAVVMASDAPGEDDGIGLDFGDLDPL